MCRLPVGAIVESIEVPPLEVAIEEMQRKVRDLRAVLTTEATDMKMLQMQIQGSVSLQVNAGPLEYASAFLGHRNNFEAGGIQVRLVPAMCAKITECIFGHFADPRSGCAQSSTSCCTI
jgi:hypothetical protein